LYGKYRDSKLVARYDSVIAKIPENQVADLITEAVNYNNSLDEKNGGYLVSKLQHQEQNTDEEIELYSHLLKDSSSKIMGTVSIPKIAVTLPIYHWSDDDVLEKGVGHIHGSSLPIGCGVDPSNTEEFSKIKGSHSLLIGHRGLPSLKLFSDLDDVGTGDMFYIKILGEIHAYKVYDTEVVLPDEVEKLKLEPGRDIVTLITCTPYGSNTHRLLVHGERVPYVGESIEADTYTKIVKSIDPKTIFGICFIAFLIFLFIYRKRQNKKITQKGKDEHEKKDSSDGVEPTNDS
jgi:LPXTG-site transpeptidase (sortase) family protein